MNTRGRIGPTASGRTATRVRHILTRREAGASFRAIAHELAAEGLPTKQGGRWHASTVRAIWRGRDRYEAVLEPPAAAEGP